MQRMTDFALVQSMTDSCSYFSMWRVFDTLSSRGFAIPTLRSRWSLSMGFLRDIAASRHSSNEFGSALDFAMFLRDVAASRHSSNEFGSALDFATLLRFSLFEAAKKSVFYQTRATDFCQIS